MSVELKEITLIHGVFQPDFFVGLKKNSKYVVVLEGRPDLGSAHHACAQLQRRSIVPTVIADNMAGYFFSKRLVKEVWLASQAADKEGAMCQIGALILAVLAKKHRVPVYISPAETKSKFLGRAGDLQKFNGQNIVSGKVNAFVPLLEWVPAKYLTLR